MKKRTQKAIIRARKKIFEAMEILEKECDLLEEKGNNNPDINWTISHLSQAHSEGLDHLIDEKEA